MSREEIIESQDYADDFWPGFVDILSGLILIFSFLILVAGIVIAVIYQTFSTVKLPEVKFKYVLAIIQKSPLMVQAQYDIIEEAKRGDNMQILVQDTKQQLEDIAEKTHQVLENYPILERKLMQEIRFLQEEINLAKTSPPPEGITQKPLDFEGGKQDNETGASPIGNVENNWQSALDGNSIFISFKDSSSRSPEQKISLELRKIIQNWIQSNQPVSEIEIAVANPKNTFATIAQKDSLRRVLYLRDLFRSYDRSLKMKITSTENTLQGHQFGWLRVSLIR